MKVLRFACAFSSLLVTLLLVSCGGMPGEQIDRAKAVPERAEKMRAYIGKKSAEYKKLPASADWNFIGPYATRENWSSYFGNAEKSVKKAEAACEKYVMPLVKENDEKKLPSFLNNMKRVDYAFMEARTFADKAAQRRTFLLLARENAPVWYSASKGQMAKMEMLYASSDSLARKAKIAYPEKSQDISGRLAVLERLRDDSRVLASVVQLESGKIADSSVDYAKFGDAAAALTRNLQAMTTGEVAFTRKTKELYRSYSKTLIDMTVEYYVKVTRTSWYEGESEFPTETERSYIREVEEETHDYFDKLPDEGSIATYSNGWSSSGLNVSIDQKQWSELEINPKEAWPDGDNDSEFWVEDTIAKTYHKYAIVENGVKTETGWVSVLEDFYWAHEKDLGLTIVSKPYGKYEDETDPKAHPPGMEYIAEPKLVNGHPVGSNQYGQWKSDASGGSFWEFYGRYALLRDMFGTPYSYIDWHDYSGSRGSAYYGRNKEYGSFGQKTMQDTRYARSVFAQDNPESVSPGNRATARTAAAASVRGSGADFRSRGPGGGGK